jgi:hypothetical protein
MEPGKTMESYIPRLPENRIGFNPSRCCLIVHPICIRVFVYL